MTTIALAVSETGIKKSLRNMFASASSLIREAAQNAYRAKATKFCIGSDDANRILILFNDGNVMSDLDWQRFFNVGKSGWDDPIRASENPFGIGCTSMLVCSESMKITSGYTVAEIDSAMFFSGEAAELGESAEYVDGTRIELRVLEKEWEHLGLNKAGASFEAFMLPVELNGDLIERPLAQQASSVLSVPFEYGVITIPNDLALVPVIQGQMDAKLFVQGLPVADPMVKRASERLVAAHLDVTKVAVSVPDRTRLVDPPEDLAGLIQSAFDDAVRYLIERKADEIGWVETMQQHYAVVERYFPEAFERSDAVMPGASVGTLFEAVREMSQFEADDGDIIQPGTTEWLSANKLAAGFLDYDGCVEVYPRCGYASWFNFAHAAGVSVLDSRRLLPCHAALKKSVDLCKVGARGWTVEAINASKPISVSHHNMPFEIIFTDGHTVTPPEAVCNNGETVRWASHDFSVDEYFFCNNTLYIGRECSEVYDFVGQISDFAIDPESDWYERDWDAQDESHAELMRMIRTHRGDGPEQALTEILRARHSELRALAQHTAGKTFLLRFDDEGYPIVGQAEAGDDGNA